MFVPDRCSAAAFVLMSFSAFCGAAQNPGPSLRESSSPTSFSLSSAAAKPEVTSTTVIDFVPAVPPGEEREGYCWTTSIAAPRPDAWRCMVGNSIHDPAFSLPGGEYVVCDANPATGEPGFKVRLTKPLPAPDIPPQVQNNGWLLELADGMVCQRRAGGALPSIDGKTVTYYCPDGSMIVGEPNMGQVWTAEKVTVESGDRGFTAKTSKTVAIRTVWR